MSFSSRLTFSQHAHGQTLDESAGLAGFPPPLGDFTFIGRWAAVFDVTWWGEKKGEDERERKATEVEKDSVRLNWQEFFFFECQMKIRELLELEITQWIQQE